LDAKQYKLTDVLWWKHNDEVLEEIARLMDLDHVTTTTPGWFQHRTSAAKNILNNMTDAQKKKLRDEAEEIADKGLSFETQIK
jgi:hypothetical protein